jgi:hypothetical protein
MNENYDRHLCLYLPPVPHGKNDNIIYWFNNYKNKMKQILWDESGILLQFKNMLHQNIHYENIQLTINCPWLFIISVIKDEQNMIYRKISTKTQLTTTL